MSSREHPVLVEPRGAGLVMFLLRSADEVRSAEYDFPEVKIDPKMIEIAGTIMERQEGRFEPAQFVDRYQEALRESDQGQGRRAGVGESQGPRHPGQCRGSHGCAAPQPGTGQVRRRQVRGPTSRGPTSPLSEKTAAKSKRPAKADKRQAALLLPIKGSKGTTEAPATAKRRRA